MKGPTIALYRPQIPPNTGNISRLCVAIHSNLIIVGKPAFTIEDKQLKRAGLDHWEHLNFSQKKFKEFYSENKERRIIPITKEGESCLWDFKFHKTDILLFGNEQKGLPPKALSLYPNSVRIPMSGEVRSLNLSNAVAILAYEFLRQMNEQEEGVEEKYYERTFYKKRS